MRHTLVRVALGIALVFSLPVFASISQDERDALIALYEATGGDEWFDRSGWLGAPGTECSWYGVYCNDSESWVEYIDLSYNNLTGTLPQELTALDSMWGLYLGYNEFSGGFPTVLTQMPDLGFLDLEGNNLSGTIPSGVGDMGSLEYLYVGYNDFEGPLPQELRLLNLIGIGLGGTNIDGTLSEIIAFFSVFSDLEYLVLSDLGFQSDVPPTISRFTELRTLNLGGNDLTGDIGSVLLLLQPMAALEELYLDRNQFTGALPQDFSSLANMYALSLWSNRISGTIPAGIGTMTNLIYLDLDANQLTGTIPPEIGNLVEMEYLWLSSNRLTGSIPTSFANLKKLDSLVLYDNQLSGPFPSFLSALPDLMWMSLWGNRLTGPIPAAIADFDSLRWVDLDGNLFDGTIPPEIGQMTNLIELWMGSNLLEGAIPPEIGNLTNLEALYLYSNNLRGEVPATITNLQNTYAIELGDNALRASNPAVEAFLRDKGGYEDYPFEGLQTVPPTGIEVDSVSPFTTTLTWTPILYDWEAGGYQVQASTTPGGPYTPVVTTATKWDEGVVVTGLQPAQTYYFIIKTVTYPHGENPYFQLNTVFSDPSGEVSATTLDASASTPEVIVTAYPQGIFQSPNTSGATDSYTLTNVGGRETTITLTQDGDFFEQSPTTFTLQSGASQVVTLTGRAMAEGEYYGESYPSGEGVDPEESVFVFMWSTPIESQDFRIEAQQNRIDLIAPEGQNPTGTVTFRNTGSGTFTGVASSDVQFLRPQTGLITIPAGGSTDVTVSSDRTRRPDADLLNGTQVGRVSLVAIGGLGKGMRTISNGATSASLVTVADTVKPPVSDSAVPPLQDNEVALFMTSVGHVVGSVGEFVSDVSILNSYGTGPVNDLKLYYKPSSAGAQTKVATMKALGSSQAVALADVVKSVFGGTAEVGTLQIRSRQTTSMSASANIFNASNPAGNYGTSIPVFRSDRSAAKSEELFITGLRKDASGHTNLYLQETRGGSATVRIDFFGADGKAAGTLNESLGGFEMKSLINPLNEGTASIRVTMVDGDGGISAFATPVDRASGDTWAVTDWAKQLGYDSAEAVIIPIGGAAKGANNTDFRTDVAITNRCASVVVPDKNSPKGGTRSNCREATGKALLRYYPTIGGVMEKEVELGLLQTASMSDVVRTVFGIDTTTVGHLVFVPQAGEFSVTSRTYTTVAGSPATYGSTVPAIGRSIAIRPGQSRRIGALSDTTFNTVAAATPATSRTNFGIVETEGESVTVRVSVYYNDPKSLASGKAIGSKTYVLDPHQLITQSGLIESIIGPSRQSLYGDLSGVQVQFDVISPTGAIVVYTSSIDNGTGDSILRTEYREAVPCGMVWWGRVSRSRPHGRHWETPPTDGAACRSGIGLTDGSREAIGQNCRNN
jgi:Leucine-rich repeat (LRR) protein